ncbi:NINE protein [Candidatus Palauibacter sp.]
MDERMVVYEAKKQSPIVAYILLVFFGVLGAHNFYLGRREQATAQLVCSGAVLATLVWLFLSFAGAGMGEFSGGFDAMARRVFALYAISIIWGIGIFAWLMVNAIQVPRLTAEHNLRLYRRMFGE